MKILRYKYIIFLKISYYNNDFLDKITFKIIKVLNKYFTLNELSISKITFPTRNTLITVLRSPHVFKKSREQFRRSIYSKGIYIRVNNSKIFIFIYYCISKLISNLTCSTILKYTIKYEK